MFNTYVSTRIIRRSWVIFALLACMVPEDPARAQHTQMTPVMNEYFRMVFAGDVHTAATLFVSEPDDHGSKMLSDKFNRRFVDRSDNLDLARIDSVATRTIAEQFQTYWRDALMQVAPLEQLEAALKDELDQMLTAHGFASAPDDEDKLLENVEAIIRHEGYFALSGRTP